MKGICFTFYESSLWPFFKAAYAVFQRSFPNWKATYFADVWATLDATTKAQMLAAQTAGIEFQNHSTSGIDVATYLETHSEEQYYTNEVLSNQNAMIADGIITPVAYAYPVGEAPRTLSNLIISKGIAIKLINKKTGGIYDTPSKSNGFYKNIYPQGVGGIGREDTNSGTQRASFDIDYIISMLDLCKSNNDVYIHSGHALQQVAGAGGQPLSNAYSTVSKLSQYCVCNGMNFYTITDLVNAGFVGTERTIPYSSLIAWSGTFTVGNLITVTVTFSDEDDSTESGSTYQWYRADDANGTNATAISGATALTYTIQAADSGKYIRFGWVPKTASQTGYEAFTKWTLIP